jgi:hypothetical protein
MVMVKKHNRKKWRKWLSKLKIIRRNCKRRKYGIGDNNGGVAHRVISGN